MERSMDPQHSGSAARVTTDDDQLVGDVPDRAFLSRIEPGFVFTSWLLCLLATVVLFAVAALILALVSQRSLTGETNTELGVLMIASAVSTIIGFGLVMSLRLARVEHDRPMNSIAVAGLHTGVALLLFLVNLVVRQVFGTGVGGLLFEGPWTDELGNAFVVLERSAAASVLACILAIGMVPEHGDSPRGTQTGPVPEDEQL